MDILRIYNRWRAACATINANPEPIIAAIALAGFIFICWLWTMEG